MHINSVKIKNFRLLKDVELTLEQTTTIIVGRNNSGKTSFTELFKRLLTDNSPKFNLVDFSIPVHDHFWAAFIKWTEDNENPTIRESLPAIEITLTLKYDIDCDDLGPLSELIIDLDPNSTEVIANIKYQLKGGRIDSLFEGINYSDIPENIAQEKKNFFRILKERIPKLYETSIFAIDPQDVTNQKTLDFPKFKCILQTDFINAQRGLDDTTHRDRDVLGKVVEQMLDIAKLDTASPSENQTAVALEEAVKDIQIKLDTDFNEHLNKLLPALSLFGYPGLNNAALHTETILDVRRLLENHTKVLYPGVDGTSLPETYNGLGSRNIIYILFKLFGFFKTYKAQQPAPNFQIVFIEEPEAHLHPQMQEVFIRKINEIANDFSHRFNDGVKWPIQFVITTHSTHIANEAPFDAIRYFLSTRTGEINTRIKDLRAGFSDSSLKQAKEFLHKYLTLTRCDLFFADKAILVEGPTERLLMPKIIEKVDFENPPEESLSSNYLSIIEVGGAYAHNFFPFLNFLEIPSLIITDIDAVKKDVRSNGTYYIKCPVAEASHTSNSAIKNWFDEKDITTQILLNKPVEEKVKVNLRIAYQIPEEINVSSEITAAYEEVAATVVGKATDKILESTKKSEVVIEKTPLPSGRSFEDAFMLANKSLFEINGNDNNELAYDAWNKASVVDKTNFALQYALIDTEWRVPFYIKDGLKWLSKNPFQHNNDSTKVLVKEAVDTND
ncbi:DNA helicase [Lysinibacillus sphaericus]|uniref:ATP-dependent nuclease n=1 Tax=Lysinibacillus sphaericus TaxID=1421 RepID=UPI0018CD6DB7|nr:AAA family ATPase [Lysinibacillus sphaericus]MBG9454980.1 DNA helicase [Lysinibacillus sphaericus]MBG9478949.1 DNA helicase [Lysinibacillus sphaericus]MBG9593354.1 DNA helicase [Lysinibacillus sphaericus]